MKKNVIIVSHNMKLGGIEKSLLGLLMSFDYSLYNIDLFLFEHDGELLKYIPKEVNLLPEIPYYTAINSSINNSLNIKKIGIVIAKFLSHLKTFIFQMQSKNLKNDVAVNYLYAIANRFSPKISTKEYDLAISFSDVHYAAIDKVSAKKKICWIHTDYSVVLQDKKYCRKMWSAYDYIAAVSDNTKASFIKKYPELASKVIVIENILPLEYVEELSKDSIELLDNGDISILSIGRFCDAKNFDNIPDICKKIVESGINVKWYIIGFGADEALIKQRIEGCGMQNHVIILGKKDNPYPYIKACDLYVQPSRYEGKCVTVREAQMLCKPVVITNYPTSSSQLEDGVDGIIVPMDNEGCANGIASLIQNSEKMKELSENCSKRDYSNSAEINKIYALF